MDETIGPRNKRNFLETFVRPYEASLTFEDECSKGGKDVTSRIFGLENLIVHYEQNYPIPENSIIFKDENRELGVQRV